MPHWKTFKDAKYLGEWDFEQETVCTIDRVVQGEVERGETRAREREPFLWFREFDRPLILNSTNAKLISMMVGSTDTRDWEGRRVVMTRGLTTDPLGNTVFGARVSPRLAPDLEPTETDEQKARRLQAELDKLRSNVRTAPAELPEAKAAATAVPVTLEEVVHATGG